MNVLGSYLSIFRRRLWLILGVTAVVAPLAYLAMTAGSESYRSRAVIAVDTGNVADALLRQQRPYEDPERRIATEVQVIEGRVVAEWAAALLREHGWEESTEALGDRVEAAPVEFSNAVEVIGSDADPQRARLLTEAFVTSYLRYRQQSERADLERLEQDLQQRLTVAEGALAAMDAQTDPDTPGTESSVRDAALARYDTVADWLEQVRLRLSVDTSRAELISPPSSPGAPVDVISPALAAVVAGLGALLLAFGIAFLVEVVRDAVRTPAEAESLIPAPVLVEMPRTGRDPSDLLPALKDPNDRLSAAARGLRVRLEAMGGKAMGGDVSLRRILVAGSPGDAEDALIVGAALAAAFGRTDMRTLLVADPVDSPVPGLDGRTEAGHDMAVAGGPSARPTEIAGLWWAPATSRPDGSAGLLDAFSPRPALDALAASFDTVVIVEPHTSELAETVAMGSMTDAVVVLCALGRTSAKRLESLVVALQHAGAHVAGMVLISAGRERRPRRSAGAEEHARAPVSGTAT